MERGIVRKVLEIEKNNFPFNYELVFKVALEAQESFKKYPTDGGHNFDNHAFPTLLNVFMLLNKKNAEYLDELLCASILHDRSRIFLGHLPFDVMHRQIMKKAGLEKDFQDRVMEIISTHSEFEQSEPFKTEKTILFLADKAEYASWDRAEIALKTMPVWMANWYKKKWLQKIDKVEQKVMEYEQQYPIFVSIFERNLNRASEKVREIN